MNIKSTRIRKFVISKAKRETKHTSWMAFFQSATEIQFRFRRQYNKYAGIYVPFCSRQVSTTGAVYKTLFYSCLHNQRGISALSSPPQTEMMGREDFISRHVGVWFDRRVTIGGREATKKKRESNRNCKLSISNVNGGFVQRRENNYRYNRRFIRFAASRLSRVDIRIPMQNGSCKRQNGNYRWRQLALRVEPRDTESVYIEIYTP